MPLLFMKNGIAEAPADAIVNPANSKLKQGSGTSRAIYMAAGEEQLTDACSRIGHCEVGNAVITPGFALRAKYIIHAVCPAWRGGGEGEEKLLFQAYTEALLLAEEYHVESIAFPLLASGNCRFPKEKDMRIAMDAIRQFLSYHDMTVYLIMHDSFPVSAGENLMGTLREFIDVHYVEGADESYSDPRLIEYRWVKEAYQTVMETWQAERNDSATSWDDTLSPGPRIASPGDGFVGAAASMADRPPQKGEGRTRSAIPDGIKQKVADMLRKSARPMRRDLDDLIQHIDETFSQMLLRLIDERGLTDSAVYKKANIDRRHFSKIRNDVDYCPNKKTVLALSVALELSLDETKDLMMRAGFAFSMSSKFDIIVQYFIEMGIYDLYLINEVLFTYGEPILC